MNWEEITKKERYIIDCKDFIYFPRVVHIVGMASRAVDEVPEFMIDIPDIIHPYERRALSMYELEKYKTFEDAEKEAIRLNNIPENKKQAEQWISCTGGRMMCDLFGNVIKYEG